MSENRPGRNVAFKVTWIDAPNGPFTGVCSDLGREQNIDRARKAWCRDPDCVCFRFHEKLAPNDPAELDGYPCMDAAIFEEWAFGVRGDLILERLRTKLGRGGLAFLTSLRYGLPEKERRVIGCFHIADVIVDPHWKNVIRVTGAEPHLAIPSNELPDSAPLFWDYHTCNGPPKWGHGLHRYIPDGAAKNIYRALGAACGKTVWE